MTLRLVLRGILFRPVRTAVLAAGFGFGITVMAGLLGVGEVILDQARSPALHGNADIVVTDWSGRAASPLHVIRTVAAVDGVRTVSPRSDGVAYLVEQGREPLPVIVRAGVPSLERALGDPETTQVDGWRDAEDGGRWLDPTDDEVLAELDRFHPAPAEGARENRWAEWLYFNGRGDDGTAFYLTFLVGPPDEEGLAPAGVRLQLELDGRSRDFSARASVDAAAIVTAAPNLDIGDNRVRLREGRYLIELELPGLAGTMTLTPEAGRAIPPVEIFGAGGWRTGYVVPVLAGRIDGRLELDGRIVSLDGLRGYHDHNWGFWRGVTWQWGQVAGEGISVVYGRIFPPPGAADPERIPGVLAVLGPAGPLGVDLRPRIEERSDPASGDPQEITIRGMGLELRFTAEGRRETDVTGLFGSAERGSTFIQLYGTFHVRSTTDALDVDFSVPGTAETFRGN